MKDNKMKLYSVLMTEEEVSLFSEFLEQKEYARGDYAGLDEIGTKEMREFRSNLAKDAWERRRNSNFLADSRSTVDRVIADHKADNKIIEAYKNHHAGQITDRSLNDALKAIDKERIGSHQSIKDAANTTKRQGLDKILNDLNTKKEAIGSQIRKESEKRIAQPEIRKEALRRLELRKTAKLKKVGKTAAAIAIPAAAIGTGVAVYRKHKKNKEK